MVMNIYRYQISIRNSTMVWPIDIILIGKATNLTEMAKSFGWQHSTKAFRVQEWVDIKDIPRLPKTAYIAPTDAFGNICDEIKPVLSNVLFPGIAKTISETYTSQGFTTARGYTYCPIGRAVTVQTMLPDTYVIATPVMWVSQNIKGTHNAYHAMYAILEEAYRQKQEGKIKTLFIPLLCTENGISNIESMRQIKQAYDDFEESAPPRWKYIEITKEQPNLEVNSQFRIHGVVE